jgi:hypothetical protein
MTRRCKDNTLRAAWSKRERDVSFGWPSGPQTKSDGHLLYGHFGYRYNYDGTPEKSLLDELRDRGYDLKTLRFSIMKDPNHPRWAPPADAPMPAGGAS